MSGEPTVYPALLYRDAKAAIKQLEDAFGFTRQALYEGEDGSVLHAEMSFGNGTVMLGSQGLGGLFHQVMGDPGPTAVHVVVADPDAHCARARSAGVEILMEPTDQDYGSRDYMARDTEGNIWNFGTYRPGGGG